MAFDVKDAQEIYQTDKSGWSDVYKEAEADLAFLAPGGQWEDAMRNSRTSAKLPALEVDQLNQYVHQVVNDIRMNTPSIDVLPGDKESDIETAEALKGLIRRIEYMSMADAARDTAMEYAVKCGIGFTRIDHQFSALTGFEQELIIKRVVNPLSIYIDSNIVECDGRDAMRGTALDSYSKKAFEAAFPDAKFISFDGDGKSESKADEHINVAEFFRIDETKIQKALMQNGDEADYKKGMDGVKTVRDYKKRTVYRYKMNGEEVLEETTFPGMYVPIIPYFGEEVWIDGKRQLYSLHRRAKDPQRRANMWASKEMELLLKAPTAPIMAPLGQLTGLAGWGNPDGAAVLEYRTIDAATGQPIPAPSRLAPPPVPTGILNAMQGAKEDIKAALGMYDASIGNKSNETSGIAIENRQRKGDVATFHFGDNGVRSITQEGRILVSAIPVIYDTQRIINIIGKEDEHKMVGVNGEVVDGQEASFDLKKGRYDVRVTTGPSFTTKRKETAQLMMEVVMQNPALMQVAGDLAFKYSDVAGADAIAARLKKTIPPQLLESEDGKEVPPEVAAAQQQTQQLQAAMQEMQQEAQGIVQENAKLKQEAVNKQGDLQIKAHEVDTNAQLKAQELALKHRELDMKAKDAAIQHFTMLNTQEQPADGGEQLDTQGIPELEQKLAQMKQAKADADNAAQMKMQQEADEKQTVEAQRQEDLQMRQAQMQQSQFLATEIIGAIHQLTAAIQAPKVVQRDDTGKVVGVH